MKLSKWYWTGIVWGILIALFLAAVIPLIVSADDTGRTTLTGEVVEIEPTVSLQAEVILTVADVHTFVAADGVERIITYNRAVFFKNAEDIEGIEVGDIVTVSGEQNGYSLFKGKIEL